MKTKNTKSTHSKKNPGTILVRCAHDKIEDLAKLKPHPRNPSKHPSAQIALLSKILQAQGWRLPIVVSKRSGLIVAGHARLQAAIEAGAKTGPVNYQAFDSEEQELAHLVADNKISELAETDSETLKSIIKDLGETDLDLSLLGMGDDLQAMLDEIAPPQPDDEHAADLVDKAAELQKKWKTKLGQIWELGEHRISCGDSTNQESVKNLLAGDKPNLMITDPPYGVEYKPKWRDEVRTAKTIQTGSVENDDIADWSKAYVLFPSEVAYVWHAGIYASTVFINLAQCELIVRAQIIWAKQNLVLSRGAYHWQHEPCWYAVRKGAKANWIGDRSQTTLWSIKNFNPAGGGDNTSEQRTCHGTQKPVECMARPIRHHSGDVYEPFSGSGTTLIACEQLKRKCRAMEISPAYVAVALQRWADLTGKTPKLLK